MFHPKSWEWWSEQFRLRLGKLKANARNLHVWNDMNEVSFSYLSIQTLESNLDRLIVVDFYSLFLTNHLDSNLLPSFLSFLFQPAIFNGPEITSPKDVIHHGGWEHRDLHNINSILFHNATSRGLIERESPSRRPFVLSRAWWVGTQKYGAIWTGDNLGTWEHLAVSVPMILANNIAGMGFCGGEFQLSRFVLGMRRSNSFRRSF